MTTVTDQYQPLTLGTPAPDFDLPATGGQQLKLSDFRGQNLIIVFYPKDQTPGCTRQLCALRDDIAQFRALNTAFVGSNPGSLESHERFVKAQSYNFPILVDAERAMAAAYHALKPESQSIQRTVYILDKDGIVRYAKQGLPPDEELIAAIQAF